MDERQVFVDKVPSVNRRALLKCTAIGATGLSLSACERAISTASQHLSVNKSLPATVGATEEVNPDFHFLSRATFGPRPADMLALSNVGQHAWLDQQLAPDTIADSVTELRAGRFESIYQTPGTCYEYERPVLREELQRHTLLRAIYSERQLFEVMVGFWSDHLNISIDKGHCIYFKATDDREVVRAHALGNFRDLIRASAISAAMLEYLDGHLNKVRQNSDDVPNENYARELLELHTMGVSGGYTQQDVLAASRCLSGWNIQRKWRFWKRWNWKLGTVEHQKAFHSQGNKIVLGQKIIAGDGISELDQLIDIVCSHPSTAQFIATKLCRQFVSFHPPETLVNRVADIFIQSRGEIRPMLREILTSPEFYQAAGQRFKRPFRFVVSAIRATGSETHAHLPLLNQLRDMGQLPFEWPTPDGYPTEKEVWMGGLVKRWDFAMKLAHDEAGGISFNSDTFLKHLSSHSEGSFNRDVFAHFIGRQPSREESQLIKSYVASKSGGQASAQTLLGFIMSTPAFQYC